MSDCPFPDIPEISKTECIGNSREKINNGFSALKIYACENSSTINSLNSRINNLSTLIDRLSGITVPGVAKAWGKFDGTRNEFTPPPGAQAYTTTNRYIYSSFNIATVYRKGLGDYRITFGTPFQNTNYIILGTSSQAQATTGLFTWFQPYRLTTAWVDVRVAGINITNSADAEHISFVVY